MNFAFPNAKIDWRPRPPMTPQQKQDKRVAELVAELRLYHHYEAADELERLHRQDVHRRLGAAGGGECADGVQDPPA